MLNKIILLHQLETTKKSIETSKGSKKSEICACYAIVITMNYNECIN